MQTAILVLAIVAPLLLVVFAVVRRRYAYLFRTPLRVRLVPDAQPDRHTFVRSYRQQLQSHGFEQIGVFRVEEMPGVVICAFTQAFKGICAVVYRHPLAGVFVDMLCVNEENQSITVTNAPAGEELDQPPGREKLIDKSMTLQDIYNRILVDRPRGPYRRIDATNFVDEFENEYAREMEWRANRGGVTEDEVRRSAEKIGIRSERTIRETARKIQKDFAAHGTSDSS